VAAEAQRPAGEASLSCRRCKAVLEPGRGDFYQITIEAVTDPHAPTLGAAESPEAIRRRIEELLARMEGRSEQELLDQVWRRLTFHLCLSCYCQWIEAPTGLEGSAERGA
jgi:hypothetical protein